MAKLAAGYSIVMKQKVGSVNTPLYPFTAIENVFDKNGTPLNELIGDISGKNFVPDYSEETTSNLRFLRNDNTWADIQDASTSQKGVVQLTSEVNPETASNTLALTQAGAKTLYDNFANYVPTSREGVASGVATLDSNGKVPSSQLPSYVDDVLEGYLNSADGKFYEESTFTTEIPAESGKIYVDLAAKKTYRWGGSTYVEISESLAIGTTAGTAYDGAAGQALADKLSGISAGANKVEASTTNGNIKIDGTETTVFTPDNASASQAGYMSASDFSKLAAISAQANKVEASTTNGNIKIDGTETTVFTPDLASASQAGYMSAAGFQKLGGCEEITVSATADEPTFTSGSGLWFEEVSAYAPNADAEP